MAAFPILNVDHRVSTAVEHQQAHIFGGFTSLPTHGKYNEFADTTCSQVLKDWAVIIGDGRDKKYAGAGLVNHVAGNGARFAFCETIPDQIEDLTYWVGLMALWDDSTESTKAAEAREKWDLPIHEFFVPVMKNPGFKAQTPMQAIMLPWVNRLLTTYYELGLAVLDALRQYYETIDSKEVEEFNTVGDLWLTFFRYGLDLHLTAPEIAAAEQVASVGMEHLALVNDYGSWPKEKVTAQEGGRVLNAVDVIMREHSLSEANAHEYLKSLVMEIEQHFIKKVNEWIGYGDRSEDARRYVEAIALCASGNMYWASSSSRYNGHRAEEIALAA